VSPYSLYPSSIEDLERKLTAILLQNQIIGDRDVASATIVVENFLTGLKQSVQELRLRYNGPITEEVVNMGFATIDEMLKKIDKGLTEQKRVT
jgi:hypothetical protein